MIEQVAVAAQVHAARAVKELDVALQLFRVRKLEHQAIHDLALQRGERIGIGRVDRREMAAAQRIRLALDVHRAGFKVNAVEQASFLHVVLGMAREQLPLELELQDGRRLVHARQLHLVLVHVLAVVLRAELGARVVGVAAHGQRGERAQRDAVADLERLQIAVLDGGHDHLRDAGLGERRRAHPGDVVVAPLHVDLMIGFQRVHDQVGARAAVEDIADDVQAVDGQRLNDAAERDDHRVGLVGLQDRLHDLLVVSLLVGRIVAEHELLDQRAHLPGHRVAHALAGVLHRAPAADLDQPVDRQPVPLGRNDALLLEQRQLFIRIVDQGGEHIALVRGEDVAVQIVDLLLDDAAGVVQDVQERLMLAVQIREKMLRALGQAQHRAQMRDLRGRLLNRSVLLAQQLEIADILRGKAFHVHCLSRALPGPGRDIVPAPYSLRAV